MGKSAFFDQVKHVLGIAAPGYARRSPDNIRLDSALIEADEARQGSNVLPLEHDRVQYYQDRAAHPTSTFDQPLQDQYNFIQQFHSRRLTILERD